MANGNHSSTAASHRDRDANLGGLPMRRTATISAVLALGFPLGLLAYGQPGHQHGEAKVIADHLFTVTDDFIVDVYHNGVKVPDGKRKLIEERFGATAERIDLEIRQGDWVVFNVVNNRMRWGGCSYFAVTGRGESGIAFTTELESGRWSCCDDTEKVSEFINDREYLARSPARSIQNPWAEGDGLMRHFADGWSGRPLWGNGRNTWIKFVAR
jgi:hypothetical protein